MIDVDVLGIRPDGAYSFPRQKGLNALHQDCRKNRGARPLFLGIGELTSRSTLKGTLAGSVIEKILAEEESHSKAIHECHSFSFVLTAQCRFGRWVSPFGGTIETTMFKTHERGGRSQIAAPSFERKKRRQKAREPRRRERTQLWGVGVRTPRSGRYLDKIVPEIENNATKRRCALVRIKQAAARRALRETPSVDLVFLKLCAVAATLREWDAKRKKKAHQTYAERVKRRLAATVRKPLVNRGKGAEFEKMKADLSLKNRKNDAPPEWLLSVVVPAVGEYILEPWYENGVEYKVGTTEWIKGTFGFKPFPLGWISDRENPALLSLSSWWSNKEWPVRVLAALDERFPDEMVVVELWPGGPTKEVPVAPSNRDARWEEQQDREARLREESLSFAEGEVRQWLASSRR